ncbi:12373_t:CDS:2 [Dentiscutata erythropus]|uniref:12373_t:CDS:1 n=1 Tax=Dentiscutata erythropus TaxID=1348616 RepID=A0A9N9AP74_9GLOM|nr:12373_t:CDS:2 [Dentiscutata erythropus]
MGIHHYIFELVAPTTAIGAVFVLLIGPIFFPRVYIWFLLAYFTTFLYISVNHFLKFCLTVRNIKKNIRDWNAKQEQQSSSRDYDSKEVVKSTATNNGRITPTRNGYTSVSVSMTDDDNKYSEMESALKQYEGQYIHAFVIPNYEEPEPLLRDTIKRLAQHRNATTTYVVILAMEESEVDQASKAASLKRTFDGSFRDFIITVHPKDVPGESRGKGSNVAYAAREACELLARKVDKRHVVFTITDSDSAIPELYIRQIEKALSESEDPYNTICSPPIFFSRNALDVPAAVRVTDIMWSIMVMQNLSNPRGLAFPCSTYSLSMVLAEQVGFWDTDKDAVGEDLHMWLKCFFKTGGVARSVPIFVPINLTNVQTTGYFSNIYARFVQAKRHYNGVADVAYSLKSAFSSEQHSTTDTESLLLSSSLMPVYNPSSGKRPSCLMSCSFFDKLVVVLHVLEAHMIPCTSGWLMFAAVPITQFLLISTYSPISSYYPNFQNPIVTSEFYAYMFSLVQAVGVLLPMPLLLCAMLYEGLHKTVDAELFKKGTSETRSWKNYMDYAWLPVSAWLFMTLPSTLACVKRLTRSNDKYVVAAKNIFTEALTE